MVNAENPPLLQSLNSGISRQNLMEQLIQNTIAVQNELFPNVEKIEEVSQSFADSDSRVFFEKELMFKMLRPLIGDEQARVVSRHGISKKEFDDLVKKAANDVSLPKIMVKPNYILYYCMACTFYLLQYQYKNIVKIHEGDIVLDCGACFGDTAIWCLRNGAKEVYSFEIDKKNLICIAETIQKNALENKIHSIPKAVGKEEGKIYYKPDIYNNGAGRITTDYHEGSYPVALTTIDTWCEKYGISPNFIKMDIEGAEFDALIGAEKTIRQNRPDLAICLYHNMSDMWKIPLLIKRFCPEYKLYCKKSHPVIETVLLATNR